jgi:dTDP-4-amino-4,6-dideoxygalactose transaminase
MNFLLDLESSVLAGWFSTIWKDIYAMQKKAQMRIPMLDLKSQYDSVGREIDAAVRRVLESQQFILGPEVKAFEEELASYCEASHAIGCASGSDAILLALMACDVKTGDEVITTPFTFFATAGSIVRLGAKPVFVDIEPSTFNIDARLIEGAITKRTKAIMPVHLFGRCANMGLINQLSKHYGLAVIEDAAQAIGAKWAGGRAGSLGDIAAFSFYPSKNLGCAGDGGALTTNNIELAEKVKKLRSHGAKKKYYHEVVGINSRLDSLQAAILRAKFLYLDEWAEKRQDNARRYRLLIEESGLARDGNVRLPEESGQGSNVYNQFVISALRRDALRAFLAENGISTEIYYPVPLHLQKCFEDLGYTAGDLPESERAAQEALAIPVYPELDTKQQEYVVNNIVAFYANS